MATGYVRNHGGTGVEDVSNIAPKSTSGSEECRERPRFHLALDWPEFVVFRAVPLAQDHRAPLRHNRGEERTSHPQLQGRGPPRALHRVVQGRRSRQDLAHRQQVPPGPAPRRITLLFAHDEQQEGAGRGGVLVRGEEHRRIGSQQERHAASSRWVSLVDRYSGSDFRVRERAKGATGRPRAADSFPGRARRDFSHREKSGSGSWISGMNVSRAITRRVCLNLIRDSFQPGMFVSGREHATSIRRVF